jgi:hypothetical protein
MRDERPAFGRDIAARRLSFQLLRHRMISGENKYRRKLAFDSCGSEMSACGRLVWPVRCRPSHQKDVARCGIGYSQRQGPLHSGNLFLYNRGTWIQPESPNRGTDYKEAGCNNEWRLPRSELDQDAKDNWRQRAAKVSRHIHHA